MPKIVQLREVAAERRAAKRKRVRNRLFRTCRAMSDNEEIAGYAIVGWDREGRCFTGIGIFDGPIGRSQVVGVAQSALTVHVASEVFDDVYGYDDDGGDDSA